MKPLFDRAAIYEITARCETPFRTSDTANDSDRVLQRFDGSYMIQGSSLAGSLRSFLRDPRLQCSLFGSQNGPGHLSVSDGIFEPDTDSLLRPRVCIDGASGTAMDGQKFDTRHIETGSRFRFSLVFTGMEQDMGLLDTVEQLLAAVDQGQILFGGQRSNGFGRVSLTVCKRVFDMTDPQDREAWIQGAAGTPMELPVLRESRQVIFTFRAQVPRVLVGAGADGTRQNGGREGDVNYTCKENIRENGQAVIPGSSLKGTVLSHLRSVGRYLQVPDTLLDDNLGRGNNDEDNGKPCRYSFLDVGLGNKAQEITRIRVDRFTGGVMTGGLFHEAPLCSEIRAEIHGPADCPAVSALMLYSLRDLGLGLFNLGSHWNIGYGLPRMEQITAQLGDRRVTLDFDENNNIRLEDPDGLAAEWQKALGGVCCEN